VFSSLFVIALMFSAAMADTIHLKDGSIIKGQIVSFTGGNFTVEIGDGSRRRQLTFASVEIESIKFDAPSGAPQLTQASNRSASYAEPAPKAVPPKIVRTADTGRPVEQKQSGSGETMKPIEWKVKVTADATSNGWTNTGWVLKKGQRVHISGDGKVSLGNGQSSPPSGLSSLDDNMKLLKNVPTGALIAVVGDDNNDFIYIGAEREITASRDGALFLGVNEGNLDDNSGSYNVKVEVVPETAP
jgi:PA-IL-like protein